MLIWVLQYGLKKRIKMYYNNVIKIIIEIFNDSNYNIVLYMVFFVYQIVGCCEDDVVLYQGIFVDQLVCYYDFGLLGLCLLVGGSFVDNQLMSWGLYSFV